jgi:hypothetical protein
MVAMILGVGKVRQVTASVQVSARIFLNSRQQQDNVPAPRRGRELVAVKQQSHSVRSGLAGSLRSMTLGNSQTATSSGLVPAFR